MNKKVSIIVPVYNSRNYLRRCLDSIISQTLCDIEIIIVNDGSFDESADIISEYQKKDERIKSISKSNSGYGNTMNVGIEAAAGEYIGIVEADDYVDNNMFDVLYKSAKKYNADVVKSDFYEFFSDSGNQKMISTIYNRRMYNKILNFDNCKNIFHYKMNTWTGLYKTSFIRENNIKYNETPGAAYQDNGFWFQTIALAKKIVFVRKAFYHYRLDNPDSSINSKEKIFCMCDEYDYIEKFVCRTDTMKEKFFNIFLAKKFDNYYYTFTRIAECYRMTFLKRFGEDFRDYCDIPFMEECKMKDLADIVSNPEIYLENYKSGNTYFLQEERKRIKYRYLYKIKKLFLKIKSLIGG